MNNIPEPIIESIRRNVNRKKGDPIPPRPSILPPRNRGNLHAEIDLFITELRKVSGNGRSLRANDLRTALIELVSLEKINRATLWQTQTLKDLEVRKFLESAGVTVIPSTAHKSEIASCDLGVTEADFALPDTGSIGLFSNDEKPRSVSLLPRVHLAMISPSAFCTDLHQVFQVMDNANYMVLITGPSRTADIELTVALGVHGPKSLYAWILSP
jgi:L-lactate dehydrogenase complex protein LldG